MRLNAKSFGLNTKIVWGIFFITLLTILMYHYVFGHIIGFTDYYEGSKSEILRRCDSGASNENIVPQKEKEGMDRQWHEYVDVIYYINRDDRGKQQFLEEMRKMGVPDEKLFRISAVKKPGKEDWGRSLSHMVTMKLLLDTVHTNCIVFEDDFVFTQDLKTVNEMFADVFLNKRNYDVVMLSADEVDAKPTQHKLLRTKFSGVSSNSSLCESGILHKYLRKAFDVQNASGYMVNKYYAHTLLQNYQDGAKTIEGSYDGGTSFELQGPFCIDQYWKRLQPQSNWYVFSPKLGGQRGSHSENKRV